LTVRGVVVGGSSEAQPKLELRRMRPHVGAFASDDKSKSPMSSTPSARIFSAPGPTAQAPATARRRFRGFASVLRSACDITAMERSFSSVGQLVSPSTVQFSQRRVEREIVEPCPFAFDKQRELELAVNEPAIRARRSVRTRCGDTEFEPPNRPVVDARRRRTRSRSARPDVPRSRRWLTRRDRRARPHRCRWVDANAVSAPYGLVSPSESSCGGKIEAGGALSGAPS